jgi:hypothetical protein
MPDKIDKLIRLSIVSGDLEIPYQLLERLFEEESKLKVSRDDSQDMINALQEFAAQKSSILWKLEHPNLLDHFGEYLSIYLSVNNIDHKKLAQKVHLDESEIKALEKFNISPVQINIDKMIYLIREVKLELEHALKLIYNSYKLFTLGVKGTSVLARYDAKKKSLSDRQQALQKAVIKMSLKSKLSISDEKEIQFYLTQIKGAYEE